MLLQELSTPREDLLRLAVQQAGYDDYELAQLGPKSNDIIDAAVAFMKDNYDNAGAVSLQRSGSYPYNLRQLSDAKIFYSGPHAVPSKWWGSSPAQYIDRYKFGEIPYVKDWYELDRNVRKLPRTAVRDFAGKLATVIELIDVLVHAMQGKFGDDPYQTTIAKVSLKKLGVI